MNFGVTLGCAGLLLAGLCGPSAQAAVIVNISQVGSSVIATAEGSINLNGLVDDDSFFLTTGVRGNPGYIAIGTGQNTEGYNGVSGPTTLGSGTELIAPTTESGDPFGFNVFFFQDIFLPRPYVSGSPLSSISTFANQTIESLGLAAGTYAFALPADQITVNIGVSSVPLPASAPLFGAALTALGIAGWRLKRSQEGAAA